jgi:hypothetical protein
VIPHLKELIVVMGIAVAVFFFARPLCLRFMRAEDFALRRNLWLALTACAFLSPSFWFYVLAAFAVIAWAGRRDSNPAALFLVAFGIIPPVTIYIPVVGINTLFALSQARILSLVLLLPLALRLFSVNEGGLARKWLALDWLLVTYLVLQLAVLSPYETPTATMRRGFLLVIDTLLVYYVFSRALLSRQALIDTMAAYVMVSAVYASIGIFESFKGWLMYEQLGLSWGSPPKIFSFLGRGGYLRAQASAGHSLTLGYILCIAFGFWLYLRSHVASTAARFLVTALLCIGIYATHSRGPWLTAVVLYLTYLFLAPGGKPAFYKGIGALVLFVGGLALTPVGERIIASLPFIGTVDQESVIFRQTLAERSWQLVWQNPFFGDPFVLKSMADLQQGTNFVDLMNAYAAVALFYGIVGLALFAGFFLLVTVRAYQRQRHLLATAPDLSAIGASLVACMLASLFFMATASIDWVEYVLAGLMASYVSVLALGGQAPGMATGASTPARGDGRFVLGGRVR